MKPNLLLPALAVLLLAGCVRTRSISNPASAEGPGRRVAHSDPAFEYRGELNEFDVLALDPDRAVSEGEIQRALDESLPVRLVPGGAILLVQSGAVLPDGAMLEELKQHVTVTPFSGVPVRRGGAGGAAADYSKSLRLAAARAGCETVVCYWGTLESARRRMETKTISWVPIAGWMLPDESQHMRIRLKLALVDVRTGRWRVLAPEPFTDKAWSTRFTRGSSDRNQIETLKRKAYAACVREMLEPAGPRAAP